MRAPFLYAEPHSPFQALTFADFTNAPIVSPKVLYSYFVSLRELLERVSTPCAVDYPSTLLFGPRPLRSMPPFGRLGRRSALNLCYTFFGTFAAFCVSFFCALFYLESHAGSERLS